MSRDAGGPDRPSGAEPDTLTVQVQGGGGEPERIFVLSRPRGGEVDVREFAVGGPDGGLSEYTCTTHEVLATVERALRERRRVSEDLYAIRRWLHAN